MPTYLDTNVVLFLHSGLADRISPVAQRRIDSDDLVVSPVVLLELEMLYEKGRIRYDAARILADLAQQLGLSVCQLPFATVVAASLPIKWTRDPGDRLITANAEAKGGAPLITSDRTIRANYPHTVW